MSSWLASQLGEALTRRSGTTIVLDPEGLLDRNSAAALGATSGILRASNWISLRCTWDLDVRRQPADSPRLVVVHSSEITAPTDLPWDIQHESVAVIRLRRPAPAEPRPLTAVGPESDQLIADLLADQPPPADDLADWFETASWWGKVRGAIAEFPSPPPSAGRAWEAWKGIDNDFRDWVRTAYGLSLSSTAPHVALHRVVHHLAQRLDDGAKILLVVIDGLGFAQWHPLHRSARLTVHYVGGSLAMIPTLTSVSRQAIFSGALPREFAATLKSTAAEERLWRRFWNARGIADLDVSYVKTLGDDANRLPIPRRRVAAVVVNAVDDILHGADVLADRQVAAGVDIWARAGFLRSLVAAATATGYETWITSDHGNLPTVASPVPREGQIVEQAGVRVRVYPNATLRAQATEYGEAWDPPGLPTDTAGYYPLFALGRSGYHSGASRVSHGGISLDEVIVPVARVSA